MGMAENPVRYPLEQPELFTHDGFILSEERPLDFHIMRILKGRVRSLLKYFKK